MRSLYMGRYTYFASRWPLAKQVGGKIKAPVPGERDNYSVFREAGNISSKTDGSGGFSRVLFFCICIFFIFHFFNYKK